MKFERKWLAGALVVAVVAVPLLVRGCKGDSAKQLDLVKVEERAIHPTILAPGTHIPDHRGVSKGLITCHLGLIVPRDGDVRMRVGDRVVRWAEGETLVFDDTYRHEVWNETGGSRVVLLIQFERPLRRPGKWCADLFLGIARRSAFVREARDNVLAWNAAMKQLDI